MRDKSGVSPVIATLLLVIIAVAAAIIVYAWTTMFTTMQTGRAGTVIAAEAITIPTSKANRTRLYSDRFNYTIGVSVRNIGSIDLSITDVYLNGTLISRNTTAACWTTVWLHVIGKDNYEKRLWETCDTQWWVPQVFLSPGEAATIYIVDAWLRRGYPCTVRVATAQGAYTDIAFYPP